jgi:hypothetical protein
MKFISLQDGVSSIHLASQPSQLVVSLSSHCSPNHTIQSQHVSLQPQSSQFCVIWIHIGGGFIFSNHKREVTRIRIPELLTLENIVETKESSPNSCQDTLEDA